MEQKPEPRTSMMIAVGDELIDGFTQDSNSTRFARLARVAGYPVRQIFTVGDDASAIARAIRAACGDESLTRILVSGGIGPTPDDRTHEAVGLALQQPLERNPLAAAAIEGRLRLLRQRGLEFSEATAAANMRAANVVAGAVVLQNPIGMSPPIAVSLGGERWLFVVPGVPREFATILEEVILPKYFHGGAAPAVLEVEFHGIPEAELAGPLKQLESEFPAVKAGSYPQTERRHLIIRLQGADEESLSRAAARLRKMVEP